MSMWLLIACSTTDGHTLEACDRVVIGASIRYGHHRPVVAAFIARRLARLGCSGGSGRFLHARFPDAQV
jgi:hypothetical protein